jgi:uncharacterized repeat protein (TIGR01451 family)
VGAHSKAPRFRRARSILTVALLAGGALVWAAGPSQALPACPIPGGFEIDGDMLQGTCTPAGDDWNTASLNVQKTNQVGTYNTGGGQAGKDHGDPSTWTSSGATPDKTDFDQAYATSKVVGTDYYVFVAWERSSTSGTQGYAIEIDNALARTASDGTPQPNRDNGGAVVFISSQGSSPPLFDSTCSFTSVNTYGTSCTNSSANITAAINTASISDPIRGTTQAAGSFFEAAINVSAITGIHPSCPGASAASVYLRSVTGQVSNGNLKGYMAPLSVAPDSTCVPPPISTTATPGGPLNPSGSSQHDTVTVGSAQAPGVGSVKFFLCTPAQVTAGGCEGTAGTLVDTKTLNANGQATSASINGTASQATGNVTDNATGKYCWRTEFTPDPTNDHHYLAGTDTNALADGQAGSECFTVVHASPTIATQSSATTGSNAATNSVGFTTLGDVATLSGVASGTDLSNENITFSLYGPLPSAPGANDCTVGARIFGPVTAPLTQVDATTWHATAPTYEPTASDGAGFYTWIASYGGDSFNDAVTGHCGDANETRHLVGPLLTLTKGTPHSTITAGDDVVYDVNLGNVGEGSASGVVVTDVLPILAGGGTWSLTGTNGYNCSLAAGTGQNAGHQVLTCTVGQLDPSTLTQIAELTAPTTTADCGAINNSASLAADPNLSQTAGPITVTVQCPHITITKVADATSVTVGSPIGFKITVTNDGQGTATGVDVEDTLPTGPGISWTLANATGPLTCGINAGVLSCTGSLAAGDTETVHITSPTTWTANTKSCGTYSNTATVSADNAVIDKPQASDSEDVLCPDLSITKTADAAAVNAGTAIGFTIVAKNTGAGDASGALISDPLPPGVTWSIENQTGPLTCGIAAGTLTCTGTLGAGTTETVHITAPTAFADCGTYDNTATLTASNTPQAPTGHDSTQVLCANLVIHKTADHSAPVSVGSSIGFTVTITNNGAGAANGVDVEDPLPAGPGINWSVDTSTGPLTCSVTGAVGNQTLKCAGDLAASGKAGDEQTVHITSSTVWNADHNSCGTYDNTATVVWANGPNQAISSNQATETVQCPSLSVIKTADDVAVSAGSDIGFEIVVNNGGPGTATSVTLNDPLPGGTGVSWSISPAYQGPGTCTIDTNQQTGAQTLSCSFGDLGSGDGATVHIVSHTTSQSCGDYDNTATLHSTNEPGIPPGSDSTTVQCPAPHLTKVADNGKVNAGEQVGFTITASNGNAPGTGTATGVVIDDPLPFGAGLDWTISPSVSGCSITTDQQTGHQTLHCNAVDLAPGASESVHVVSNTTFQSCATLDNTATLTGTNFDQQQASDSTTVQCPSLTIGKTADDATIDAGDNIGFTVTVANGGPGTAKGVVVNDPLPGGPGINWGITSGPANCSIVTDQQTGHQTLTCTAFDLGANDDVVIHVSSATEFASCATYDNTATVTATNSAPVTPANASTTVQCADVTVTKHADDVSVDAGSQIGFTISVSNSAAIGTGTAHGVVLSDPLPGGAGTDWTIDPAVQGCAVDTDAQSGAQTLTCDPVDLAPGESLSVHIVSDTTFASCKAYPNTAQVSGSNIPDEQASDTTTVDCPNLSLTKTADADPVTAGDSIGFTVTVSNDAQALGTATGVVFSDPLPGGAGVSWTIDPAVQDCTIDTDAQTGAQTLNCGPFDLGPDESFSVHVTSPTSGSSCQVYPNEVSLTGNNNHPALTADASTTVQCPDVTLLKTADADTVSAGQQIGFTITASNSDATGTGQARGVAISDPLPGGADINWSIESGPANCAIDTDAVTGAQTLTCTAVDLDPGDTESVHVVSDTTPQSCAVYDNTATLTLTNGAVPSPAEARTEVQCPSLAISKTADADSVRAGHDIGFLVTVSNAGPGTALGATLSDPLPSGDGVSWSIDPAATSAPGCSIGDGSTGQTLTCALGDLPAGGSYTVHLVSATTDDSCARYPNVATLAATNAGELTANATTKVTNCLGTGGTTPPPPPPTTPPAHGTSGTGVPVKGELELVILLLGAGLALVAVGRRRRRARH